ncbi:TrmB family transcriptional regulator [Halosimplex aquaticum]|uniref:TrmB family transcriptional regulator n=1 Tax=Halosimplex aquaticum TaxID=3026162 RepID=A0ABD5XT60_9EURY|nr:helix-turn-helix domain-containing protein [Halosimplex aquaticum]
MQDAQEAIDALENLGLTEYEARCFVALAQLPHGTAKEIGQVADIPRSRVYETMERLQRRGLVELHEAEPRQYQSVSIETAIELLRTEYESYFDSVERTLRQLEPTYKKAEQAVWAINTHEQVTGRVVDLLSEATDEILLLVMDPDLFDEDTVAALEAASERGVAVYVGTCSGDVRQHVESAQMDATVFSTDLIEWFTETGGSPRVGRVGRVLLVDRNPVLVSAIHEEELPGVPNETAAWSDGVDHGFATFAERVLTFHLQENIDLDDEIDAETDG